MKRTMLIIMAATAMLLSGCIEKEVSCKLLYPGDEGYVYREPRLYSEEYMSVAQVYDEAGQMAFGDTIFFTGILYTEAKFYVYDSVDYVYYMPQHQYGTKYFGDHAEIYMPVSDVEYEEQLMAYEGRRCYVKGVINFVRTIHHPWSLCQEGAIVKPIEILFD